MKWTIALRYLSTKVNVTACSVFPALSIEQNYICVSHRTVKKADFIALSSTVSDMHNKVHSERIN